MGPLPAPPEFPEPIEAVRERIAKVIGKVAVPRDVRNWHPSIDRLLKEDDKRREKQLAARFPMSWDNPLFDTPFECRRPCILNSLFLAVTRMNGKPTIGGSKAREIHLTFHKQHVGITLDQPKQSNPRSQVVTTSRGVSNGKLALSILEGLGSQKERTVWQDDESGKLEARMTNVAVQVVLTAEVQHRERAVHHYQWRVERKAQLEEEERKRKIEAERVERERQRRMEQARIDRLLGDAAAFHQAGEIRQYVELLRERQSSNATVSPETFEEWSRWALAQADRIDPSVGDAFLNAIKDEDGA